MTFGETYPPYVAPEEPVQVGSVGDSDQPRRYIRVAVTKNTKGYSYETTVSLEWRGSLNVGAAMLGGMLREADDLGREEVVIRKRLDSVDAGVPDRDDA